MCTQTAMEEVHLGMQKLQGLDERHTACAVLEGRLQERQLELEASQELLVQKQQELEAREADGNQHVQTALQQAEQQLAALADDQAQLEALKVRSYYRCRISPHMKDTPTPPPPLGHRMPELSFQIRPEIPRKYRHTPLLIRP